MAASVNNIAATFAAARGIAPPSSTTTSASSPSACASFSTTTTTTTTTVPPPRPISASWNPHSSLPRSQKSSLLSLYGPPGPRHHLSALLRPSPPRSPSISVGHRLPNATLSYLDPSNSVRTVTVANLTRGKKAVILSVPGAFAPRTAAEGLIRRAAEMREKGGGAAAVVVACVGANDVYVMKAWGERLGAAAEGVAMLSDPDAEFARGMGMAVDMAGGVEGFGVRSEGYCLVALNGFVKTIFLNHRRRDGGGADDSGTDGFDNVLRVL